MEEPPLELNTYPGQEQPLVAARRQLVRVVAQRSLGHPLGVQKSAVSAVVQVPVVQRPSKETRQGLA